MTTGASYGVSLLAKYVSKKSEKNKASIMILCITTKWKPKGKSNETRTYTQHPKWKHSDCQIRKQRYWSRLWCTLLPAIRHGSRRATETNGNRLLSIRSAGYQADSTIRIP